MSPEAFFTDQAHKNRAYAERSRRLARGMSTTADQEKLEQYAAELDAQADQLERMASQEGRDAALIGSAP